MAPLFRLDTEETAVAMANTTEYRLPPTSTAAILGRRMAVSGILEYGMIGVNSNSSIISTAVDPFSGVKQPDLGCEGSRYGIEEYLEIKYLCLDIGRSRE